MGCNFLNVYEKFGPKFGLNHDIAPSAFYLLSAPSTPDSVRQEAIQRAESGEKITHKDAKELKAAHKRIQDLESQLKPNPDNLEIKNIYG